LSCVRAVAGKGKQFSSLTISVQIITSPVAIYFLAVIR
jgi:hypothetical protein